MKILWMSNAPWWRTGYGTQTKIFAKRINELEEGGKRLHEVNIFSWTGLNGSALNWGGMNVLPPGIDLYGNDVMSMHAHNMKAQIILSLIDAWVIRPQNIVHQDIKWCPWFPVDSEPLSIPVGETVRQAHKRIVFSRFGERMVNERGMDCYYVPHGVDTKIFKPLDNKKELRTKYGMPTDVYIIGMVAANKGNPSRKAFLPQLLAFKEFKKKHTDAFLYLHTSSGASGEYDGVNLPEYLNFLGLKENIDYIFVDQYSNRTGNYDEKQMAEIYNCMDVHLLVSMGEGFGIPILEAQSCGVPVIVGDWTAMSELCFGGWKVAKSDAEKFWVSGQQNYMFNPHMDAILDKLEAAYTMFGNTDYNERARKGALAYDADKIVEKYWKPTLADIEASLPEPIEAQLQKHKWYETGIYNADGTFSVPCTDCMDELIVNPQTRYKVIVKNGFTLSPNGVDLDIEDHPTGGVSKIVCREIARDYNLDLDYQDGDVVLDIGAQVGIVSCYLGKKYPNIKIYAFEPVRENFDRLQRNLDTNGVKNVTPLNMAVTSNGRYVDMTGDLSHNSGSMTIYGKGKNEIRSLTLQNILDAYKIDKVKLLKIDVEGSEYEILESSKHLLDRVGAVRGEIHPLQGKSQDELLELLRANVKDVIITVLR